jgi:hypothetical protein
MLDFLKRVLGLAPKQEQAPAPIKVELPTSTETVPVHVVETPVVVETVKAEEAPVKAKVARKPRAPAAPKAVKPKAPRKPKAPKMTVVK